MLSPIPPGFELFGYHTGNGSGDNRILMKDGIPVLTPYQQATLKYFCYPEESTATSDRQEFVTGPLRPWSDPEYVVLPQGTLITPSMDAVSIPGQPGIFFVKRPRGEHTFTAKPMFSDPPRRKSKRKKKDPALTEVAVRQAQLATQLLDVSPSDIIDLRHPDLQAPIKRIINRKQKHTVTLKVEIPDD